MNCSYSTNVTTEATGTATMTTVPIACHWSWTCPDCHRVAVIHKADLDLPELVWCPVCNSGFMADIEAEDVPLVEGGQGRTPADVMATVTETIVLIAAVVAIGFAVWAFSHAF